MQVVAAQVTVDGPAARPAIPEPCARANGKGAGVDPALFCCEHLALAGIQVAEKGQNGG